MVSDQVFLAALSLQGSLYVLLSHPIHGGIQSGRGNCVEYSSRRSRSRKHLKLSLHSRLCLISDCHNYEMQSARGKCFGSTILAETHMVVEKMHTQERVIATKTIITMLVVKTTALISSSPGGPRASELWNITEKKQAKLDHRVTMRTLQLPSGTQTLPPLNYDTAIVLTQVL